jgi:hypothetical protein
MYKFESPSRHFTWGSPVRVKANADEVFHPGELAEVVGISAVENAAQSAALGASIGTTIYLIEFADGSAIDVPEAWLEAADP